MFFSSRPPFGVGIRRLNAGCGWLFLAAGVVWGGFDLSCSQAEQPALRPTAPKLFPDNTLAYLRIDDSRELRSRLRETSTGKMASDPQISPILGEFYRSFSDGMQVIQREFGISLDEVLDIPNGEMAIGIIPGERQPIPIVLIEAGEEMPALEILVDRVEQRLQSRGAHQEEKTIGTIQVTLWQDANRADRQFGYFIDSGVLVACLNTAKAEALAKIWSGNGVDHVSLAENRRFTSLLSRCVGTEGERPHVSFYVDPMAILGEIAKNNLGAATTQLMLQQFGVDGIQAVGGSLIMTPKGFDSMLHAHLSLANPRRGLLEIVRPKSGDTEPPAWVSEDVQRYMTANWNMLSTWKALKEIYGTFRGPEAFENDIVKGVERNLGIDLDKEFVQELSDRVTMVQVVLRPAQLGSESRVVGFKIKNPQMMANTTLPKVFDKIHAKDAKWTKVQVGATTAYSRPSEAGETRAVANEAERRPRPRRPDPSFAVVGDELLISDSLQSLRQAIETAQSAEGGLSQSIEYKFVRDQMKLQLNEQDTSIVMYDRPEEGMRMLYDLAADRNNVDRLREMSKNNPLFAAIVQALDNHQLPPFETIAKYLSPGGAYITEDESGLHYTAFSLKRE